MLLADVEKQLMDKGMDDGRRNLIVEKMRAAPAKRDEPKPKEKIRSKPRGGRP